MQDQTRLFPTTCVGEVVYLNSAQCDFILVAHHVFRIFSHRHKKIAFSPKVTDCCIRPICRKHTDSSIYIITLSSALKRKTVLPSYIRFAWLENADRTFINVLHIYRIHGNNSRVYVVVWFGWLRGGLWQCGRLCETHPSIV